MDFIAFTTIAHNEQITQVQVKYIWQAHTYSIMAFLYQYFILSDLILEKYKCLANGLDKTKFTWRREKLSCTWHVKSAGQWTHYGAEQRNSLTLRSRKCGSNCIFKFIYQIHFADWQLGQSQWNLCKMHTVEPTGDKPILVQAMPCCRQTTSHYMSQCPPIFIAPYGVIRTQWVKARRSVNPLRCGIQTQSKQKIAAGRKSIFSMEYKHWF